MRYTIGKPKSERTVKRFLLFPKMLPVGNENGKIEMRWLETVNICKWLGWSGTWWDGFFVDEKTDDKR
jgi:hypothetical protein